MGYDPDYFVSSDGGSGSVDETLLCPVCQCVYDTPMVLDPCGHSFCKSCVATLLNSGHENCPVCRTKMIEGKGVGIPPNRALKDLISNMTVRCMNCPGEIDSDENDSSNTNANGDPHTCPWTGKLSEFTSHSEKHCPMFVVSCPVEGCDFEGPRSSMSQHNADSLALHTDLLIASKLDKLKEELMGSGIGNHTSNGNGGNLESRLDALEAKLEEKDHELNVLKARLLDNWLNDFFKEWILSKPPFFQNFVVYRPIKYLTGPISQIIVGIPGPDGSDWEGGLYPLLITFTPEGFERKEPPKCDFPRSFFHPNVYEGNVHVNTLAEFDGTWDPSISVQEIFFCIQQLLNHPNHRGSTYDPETYREKVRRQAEKYSRNDADFLEQAMVGLQSKIDPHYKMPLESWENVRWENLEEARWKGKRSFQSRKLLRRLPVRSSSNNDVVAMHPAQSFVTAASSNDSVSSDESEENDENNEDVVRPVLSPIANANSTDLSPTRTMMPIEADRLRDENGEICKCSCCEQGSRSFLDREQNMRYLFGEGG